MLKSLGTRSDSSRMSIYPSKTDAIILQTQVTRSNIINFRDNNNGNMYSLPRNNYTIDVSDDESHVPTCRITQYIINISQDNIKIITQRLQNA